MGERLLKLWVDLRRWCAAEEEALLIAGRVGLAAVLAYLAAAFQHLHEIYWPVLSAVIVARGGAKGAGGSAGDRLMGTLAGAAVGLAVSMLRQFGLPDWALLFIAMAPLAFVSVDRSAFRAAPMAAMIVLSAAAAGRGGFTGMAVAVGRTLDVGLGTLIALFVSYVLLPSHPMRAFRRDAAALMTPLANLLSLSLRPEDAEAREKFVKLNAKVRRDLRELVIAARQIRLRGRDEAEGETPPVAFAAVIARTQGSIGFMARALGSAPLAEDVREALKPLSRAARTRLQAVEAGLLGRAEPAAGGDLGAAVDLAGRRILLHAADNPAVHLEAMPFLLQTLKGDLDALLVQAAALPGRRGAAPAADATAPSPEDAAGPMDPRLDAHSA